MTSPEAAPRIIYPRRDDPRWIQIACLTAFFAFYASFAPTFHRGPGQFAASFAGCIGLDIVFLFLRRIPLVPLSGFMTALWTVILIDSTALWVYALAGGLAALSKHLIRVDKQHLCVPNNFGTVVTLLLFPGRAALTADPWEGSTAVLLAAASIGLVAARKANRMYVPVSFLATFIIGAMVRSLLRQAAVLHPLSSAAGPAFHLFTFFHLTDPKATPVSRKGQIVYGCAIGLVDALLRLAGAAPLPYLALFLVAFSLPVLRRRFDPKDIDRSWRLSYASMPRWLVALWNFHEPRDTERRKRR